MIALQQSAAFAFAAIATVAIAIAAIAIAAAAVAAVSSRLVGPASPRLARLASSRPVPSCFASTRLVPVSQSVSGN